MQKELLLKLFSGTWKGTDHGRFFENETNSWIVNRFNDGTFVIKFKTLNHLTGLEEHTEEIGEWWIEDDVYYEIKESGEDIDSYVFNILSSESIQFIDTSEIDVQMEPYNFIDLKVYLD